MSTLNAQFFTRALIIIGTLASICGAFFITELLTGNTCTLSSPQTNHTPIALTCTRPFTISQTNTDIFFDIPVSPTLHLFVPQNTWDNITSLSFTLHNPIIQTKKDVTFPFPEISPAILFSEKNERAQKITEIKTTTSAIHLRELSLPQKIQNPKFDGETTLYYIADDSSPRVMSYDTLTKKTKTFLKSLLGKQFTYFAPSDSEDSYTYVTRNDAHVSVAQYTAGTPESHELSLPKNPTANLVQPLYAPDKSEVIAFDEHNKQLVVFDVINGGFQSISPIISGALQYLGFLETDETTPFIKTSEGAWKYKNETWEFTKPTSLEHVVCQNGTVFFSLQSEHAKCTGYTIEKNNSTGYFEIFAHRNSQTQKIYESKQKLEWVSPKIATLVSN